MYLWSAMAGPPPQMMMSRNGGLSRPSANIGRFCAVSRDAALPRRRLSVFPDGGQAQRTKNEQATDKTGMRIHVTEDHFLVDMPAEG
jgi:hypothetical protein